MFIIFVPHLYLALEAVLFNASSDTKCEHYSNTLHIQTLVHQIVKNMPFHHTQHLSISVFISNYKLHLSLTFSLAQTTSILLRRKILLKLTKKIMNDKVLQMSIRQSYKWRA